MLGEARTTLGRVRMKPGGRTLEKVRLVSRLTIYHSDATVASIADHKDLARSNIYASTDAARLRRSDPVDIYADKPVLS